MSKKLIEHLAKKYGSRGNRNSNGDFLYEFTGTNLEAFAKAYAQTQGQSDLISKKDLLEEMDIKLLENGKLSLQDIKEIINAAPKAG